MSKPGRVWLPITREICFGLFAIALFTICNHSVAQDRPQLPLDVPDDVWMPLRQELDVALQTELRKAIADDPQWRKLVANKKMSISIVDLNDPATPRFAHVNGDVMMYAASLPKIAILLAAMVKMESGELEETDEVVEDLVAMIRYSNNGAATRSIDRVGGLVEIEKILTNPEYGFFDESQGGGLWVGKRYSKSNVRNPDPMKGLSHAATATQVSRFYYLVAEGRLVNRERSKQMLDILADPGINHKFVNVLHKIAPGAKLFRKSGSWRTWHSDSVLVWGPERRYIAVCLVNADSGEAIIRKVLPVLDELLIHLETEGSESERSRLAD